MVVSCVIGNVINEQSKRRAQSEAYFNYRFVGSLVGKLV